MTTSHRISSHLWRSTLRSSRTTSKKCHSERSEESAYSSRGKARCKLRRQARRVCRDGSGHWRRRRSRRAGWFGRRRGLTYGEVLAHFFEALRADPADGAQVVNTFECAVRFTHLQNFFSGDRADSRHLLKLFGTRRIQIDRRRRRLLLGRQAHRKRTKRREQQEDSHKRSPQHRELIIHKLYC